MSSDSFHAQQIGLLHKFQFKYIALVFIIVVIDRLTYILFCVVCGTFHRIRKPSQALKI